MKIVAASDSGALHTVLDDGRTVKTLKIGEHISDICEKNGTVFATVYHENKIVKVENGYIVSETYSKYFPQKIIVGNDVFCLFTDGEYCYIEKFDFELKREHTLKILFDFYLLKLVQDGVLLTGEMYIYLLDEKLKIKYLCISDLSNKTAADLALPQRF